VVICTLLFALMICIIIRSNKNGGSSCTAELESPMYECISGPVYEYLNPMVTSVMTENEAYNTCSEEISAYDIV
jgi:hypothetical protein